MNTTTLYVIQFNNSRDEVAHWVDLSEPYINRDQAGMRVTALAGRNTFMHYRLVKREIAESVLHDFPPQNTPAQKMCAILDKQ